MEKKVSSQTRAVPHSVQEEEGKKIDEDDIQEVDLAPTVESDDIVIEITRGLHDQAPRVASLEEDNEDSKLSVSSKNGSVTQISIEARET